MSTPTRFVLAFALAIGAAAIGCGPGDSSNMPGGDDGSGGGDDGGGQPRPLDASGTYALHSTFDLATNMPGTAGTVVNTIIAATDDSDDPTAWIVDQIIAALPAGTVKDLLGDGKTFVVGFLNDKLLEIAPDFVTTMVQVGRDFGDIAHQFGLNETLQLTGSGGSYVAIHTVTGAHFKIGNQVGDYAFANYGAANVVVDNVAVTMDQTGQLTIAPHSVPLAYGQVLRMGLDAGIIPLIDPSARDLQTLIADKVDCNAIGAAISDAIQQDVGITIGASTFASACTSGLQDGAQFVYSKIDAIDGSVLDFGINGTARGADTNSDGTIDAIQTGTWAGTLTYGNTPAPLSPSAFYGTRM